MPIASSLLRLNVLVTRRHGIAATLFCLALALGSAPPAQGQTAVSGVTAIGAGENHTCLLTSTGAVRCWGANFQGQLGNGGADPFETSAFPSDVLGLSQGVTQLAVGDNHACALTAQGGVKCWGSVVDYLPGNNSPLSRPVDVELGRAAIAVASGNGFSCALLDSGGVRCWGTNEFGQLGDGTFDFPFAPVSVVGLPGPMLSIEAGGSSACARSAAGATYCWGRNSQGQLALGTFDTNQLSATSVTALDAAYAELRLGGSHGCGVRAGAALCWGLGVNGQLGDGSRARRALPGAVTGLSMGVTHVSGGLEHSCATLGDGTARCWGRNNNGQLGDGTGTERLTPVQVTDLAGVASIAAGHRHSCALLASGGVRCWGLNSAGQLGDGTTQSRLVPVAVVQRSAPDAPTAATAVAGDASATVSFLPPARNGGLEILGYVVTSQPGNVQSGLCAGSPCVVSGLEDGTEYTFIVVARNALGDSPASAPSPAVTTRRLQTLVFGANPGPLPRNANAPSVSATASSGLAVSYSSLSPSVCEVDAGSGALSLLALGPCTVAADQAGNAAYRPAPRVTQTVDIVRSLQSGFAVATAAPLVLLGGSTPVSAAGGQTNGAISFALQPGSPCTLTDSLLVGIDVGTCTVVATREGDAEYQPISASVAVNVFARGLSGLEVVGQSLSPAFNPAVGLYTLSVANGVQQIPVRATARDPLAAVLLNNQIATPGSTIAVNLNTGANLLPVTVIAQDGSQQAYQLVVNRRFAQSIQLTLPATAVLGDAPLTLSATGGASGQPVQISSQTPAVCGLDGNELQLLSAGRCELRANQAGDANHDPAPELLRTIEVQPGVDLQISVDNGVASLAPQGAVVYRIEVGNAGPSPAPATRLSAMAPAGLADIEWVCTPVQGASCPAATGTGLPTLSVDLPVGGVLRFDVGARLNATPGTTVQLSASLQPPAGTVERAPADNTAVDTDTVLPFGVFSNGFEPTSTGLRMQQR